MKKAAIIAIIGVIVLVGAGYGHHKEVLAQEKVTVTNEIALLQQEIAGGNIAGANADLDKIMHSNYPLTKVQETEYRKQIDNIDLKKDTDNSNIASISDTKKADKDAKVIDTDGKVKEIAGIKENTKTNVDVDDKSASATEMSVKKIIATYIDVNSIDNMNGISEASINGVVFYKATEGAGQNGELINLDKVIKPVQIFKGVEGYKFSMRGLNSKINCYFYMSKAGKIYTWDQVLEGFKNGTLTADIGNGLNNTSQTDLRAFVGEFGPNAGTNVYYRWQRKNTDVE